MNTLVVFLVLVPASVFAQSPISKGTIILNGNLYYSSQSYDNSDISYSTLRINPQVGFFIVDNLALNLDLSYEKIDIGIDISRYGIGPNLRYYFDLEKYFPFISIGYSFTSSSQDGGDYKQTGNQYILGAGISYLITKNVAIEASINYKFDQEDREYPGFFSDETIKSKIIMLGVGFNFYLY
jgi:opacity protein-like surface antigen